MIDRTDVRAAIGDAPNEVFLRTGQFVMAVSVLAYLGISGFGIELKGHSSLAPVVTGSAALFMMMYGAYLKKKQHQEKQAHEIRLALVKAEVND
jgi:arginine exporter protein ArgO